MLAQKNRFHRRNQLRFIHKNGASVRGNDISLRYVDGLKHPDYRVSVVVSRKVSKKAVVRNRIRRRIYGVVGNMNPPIRGDIDMIISVFDDKLAEIDHQKLKKTLEELIDRAGLRKTAG